MGLAKAKFALVTARPFLPQNECSSTSIEESLWRNMSFLLRAKLLSVPLACLSHPDRRRKYWVARFSTILVRPWSHCCRAGRPWRDKSWRGWIAGWTGSQILSCLFRILLSPSDCNIISSYIWKSPWSQANWGKRQIFFLSPSSFRSLASRL